MHASPATTLTLKARMLCIAQFVNAELSKINKREDPRGAAGSAAGGGGTRLN